MSHGYCSSFLSCLLSIPAAGILLIGSFLAAESAVAETLETVEKIEEAALRQELERIVKEDPEQAKKARKTLEALDRSRTSKIGRQLRNRRREGTKRIVNGLVTFRHSSVAAVLSGRDPDTATAWCTGTVISCDKVLTAAHCVARLPDPNAYLAYFENFGFVKVSHIDWPKDQYDFPYADLAILTLAKPVEGIAPIALNTVASPIKGSYATIVGYGRTGGSREDYGIKRDGSVKFDTCQSKHADKKLLCWKFDADINTAPGDSNTCNADSGGGVFMVDKVGLNIEQRLVGVVSGGRDADCVKNDNSYNTDIFLWREWIIKATQESLSHRKCSSGARFDDPINLHGTQLHLSRTNPEAAFEINVPRDTASLRVAMNGEDAGHGQNDFDLFVFQGASSPATNPICKRDGPGQFAFCEITDPKSGKWTVAVRRKKGDGLAQVTTTLIPGRASQQSNE
jgi:trypsin